MILSRCLPAIRASARAFVRTPGLSIALLLTIAIGVGSNASVYGFVQGLTNPRLPLKHADRIVSILGQDRFHELGQLSHAEYLQLKHSSNVFAWIGAARIVPTDIAIDGHPKIAIVAAVTLDLAEALDLPQGVGVIVSQHLWQKELDGKADVLGHQIRVDNTDFPIIGIAPERMEGLYSDRSVDLWMPLQDKDLQGVDRSARDWWVLGSLRASISPGQAQSAVRMSVGPSSAISVVPFTGAAPRTIRGLSRIRMLLNVTAGAVFFIASINVASFLMGRALKRSHETSLRVALGATRRQLIRELLSDSIVISLAGGVIGVLLAVCTARIIPALLFEEDAEHLVFAPHLPPIFAASIASVCITIISGMMPVFATVTDRPWIILGRESGLPSKKIESLRTGLVIGQITACYVLVISSVFLVRGLHAALETSTGRSLGDPILLTVQAQMRPEVDLNYFNEVKKRVKSVANLSPLAWTAQLPGNQPKWRSFSVDLPSSQFRDVEMEIDWLTSESLKYIDRPPIAGRMFGVRDPTRKEALVDENAAHELFGAKTAGMMIQDPFGSPVEVIGVVKRIPTDASNEKRPTIYYDYTDHLIAPEPTIRGRFRAPVSSPVNTELNVNVVSSGYFETLGMPLVAGQKFSDHQVAGQGRIGILNQEAADLYFSGKPLGAAVIDDRGVRTQIIGVVQSQVFGIFQQHAEPAIYFPIYQDCPPRMTLIIDHSKSNAHLPAELRRRIKSVPGYETAPIAISTFDAQLAQSAFAPLRIATLLSGASALTASILSIFGLFSVQRDAQLQRRRELALRIALGAQRWRIGLRIMSNAGKLVLGGTLLGTSITLALLRVLLSGTTIISSPPLWIWVIVALSTGVSVLIASALPAVQASIVDPLTIMRDDR
ncbi:ABC transporter permease [Alloacidobacterium dinghuense]|uniref:ABC transporter permease n=1 Tax=Alloacidobacterium dinghuense TaxID=2763107 RepID=A0A7G8BDL8_9BACT|nr:ABC transporter permease [Alloacidobacterium dinghuense]QNI30638.1 ABC transporter permease [Alloacidobacterium dinghuense]